MSRERNYLQRHIEECLVEREAMRKWIREAEARSPWITVTESDWEQFDHLSVGAWLKELDADNWDPHDDWIYDSWDDEIYDYCYRCRKMFDVIGGCRCQDLIQLT